MTENHSTMLLHPLEGQDQLQNLQQTLGQLLSRNEFVDLTLCCQDGHVQAHRVVLALASTYIHNTLVTTHWPTPCSHPVLFFKTSTMEDMKIALKFIYTGRVQVDVKRLPKIMDIARDLGCTYLVKAVEKAIQSCGIELFRQRVIHPSPAVPSQQVHAKPSPASARILRTDLATVEYSEGEASEHQLHPEIFRNPDLQNMDQATGLPVSPKDIKTEAVDENEDLVNVLDGSMQSSGPEMDNSCKDRNAVNRIIHSPGTGSTSNSGSGNALFFTEEKQPSAHFLQPSEDHHAQTTTRTSMAGDGEEMADFGDFEEPEDQLMNEEEEEQMMPISVVDLKSLAEPVMDSFSESIIGMPFSTFSSDATSSCEQPASCPWCPQIFTSASLLQKHVRTHVGTYKPFACPYCSTSFARSAHLKRHIRTHTGEKPFVCTVCDKAFSRQDKLKVHLERHMQTQPQGHQTSFTNNTSTTTTTTASSSTHPYMKPVSKTVVHGKPKTNHSQNNLNQRHHGLERTGSSSTLNFKNPRSHFPSTSPEQPEEHGNSQFMESGVSNVVHWHVKNDSSLALGGNAGFNPVLVSSASISPSTTITPISSAPN